MGDMEVMNYGFMGNEAFGHAQFVYIIWEVSIVIVIVGIQKFQLAFMSLNEEPIWRR